MRIGQESESTLKRGSKNPACGCDVQSDTAGAGLKAIIFRSFVIRSLVQPLYYKRPSAGCSISTESVPAACKQEVWQSEPSTTLSRPLSDMHTHKRVA